jgi:hypothetical protein
MRECGAGKKRAEESQHQGAFFSSFNSSIDRRTSTSECSGAGDRVRNKHGAL